MIEIALFDPRDYDEVMGLWSETEGLTLRDADSRQAITRYLERNPNLSFVARDQGRLVGAVLAGTDGRRGYLQHLAVASSHRGEGARAFWQRLGWSERDDIILMSHTDSGSANA